jgi:SPP1 family predicted phage head-tail adaptor
MQASLLAERITIQEKQVTRNAYGAEDIEWLDIATVWAEAEPWRMKERLVARRNLGEAVISFRVRHPCPVALDKRILWNGSAFNVIEIDATKKRQGELSFIARGEEISADG